MKFEERLKKLEAISEKMKVDNISLDDSIASFEEGMKLATELEKELSDFEKRVQILTSTPDGDVLEDF